MKCVFGRRFGVRLRRSPQGETQIEIICGVRLGVPAMRSLPLRETPRRSAAVPLSFQTVKFSKKPLTGRLVFAIIVALVFRGEMAEWFKALVLKTSDVERHRGFESLSLRQNRIDVEKYPRGRRGSPAKGVGWDNCREGSNPSFSAT